MEYDNSTNVDAINDVLPRKFITLTWNVEGMKRNVHNLKHFVSLYQPDFIFLSEPQLFNCDADHVMKFFKGEYSYKLNSSDVYDPDLSLLSSKAHGGTLTMWKHCLNSCIEIHQTTTPAITPIIFNPPGFHSSVHICVYLPTAGLETQFLEELSNLSSIVDELRVRYPDSPLFLRGDFNVSDKNISRRNLFEAFLRNESLLEVNINHHTYHHFTGNGQSDSSLDKLFYSRWLEYPEVLSKILCKHEEPLIY